MTGVYFSHFLMRFAEELAFDAMAGVCNSEVSGGRHSTVFRNLKETRRSSYIENILAQRIE